MNKDYLTEWLKTYLPQRDLKWREGFAKELLALFEAEQEKLVEKIAKKIEEAFDEKTMAGYSRSVWPEDIAEIIDSLNSKGGANE